MTYQDAAQHAVRLFADASEEQLQQVVRWTPKWTARDVLAHLVNNAQLAVAGVKRPPSNDAAHEAVVAARDLPIVVLTGSLEQLAGQVPIAGSGPTAEWDIVVHLADVRETWGLPQLPEGLWRPVLRATLGFCAASGRFDCQVTTAGHTWGSGPVVVINDHYQLFRALFARRPLSTLDADGNASLLASAVFFA